MWLQFTVHSMSSLQLRVECDMCSLWWGNDFILLSLCAHSHLTRYYSGESTSFCSGARSRKYYLCLSGSIWGKVILTLSDSGLLTHHSRYCTSSYLYGLIWERMSNKYRPVKLHMFHHINNVFWVVYDVLKSSQPIVDKGVPQGLIVGSLPFPIISTLV